MKALLKTLCIVLVVAMQFSFTGSDSDKLDCTMLHSGTFTYTDDGGNEVIVVIEGDTHTEFHQDKKYVVESTIKWVNDCEYNATVTKATLPEFPFKKGTVMNVKVDSIEGSFIYYTGTVKGKSYKGSLKKEAPEGTNNR
jgi:hypothetical protein